MSITLKKETTAIQEARKLLDTRIKNRRKIIGLSQFWGRMLGLGSAAVFFGACFIWATETSSSLPLIHHLLQNHPLLNPFSQFISVLHGPLGMTMATAAILIGAGVGIAKNSMVPILASSGMATFIWFGPTVLGTVMDPHMGMDLSGGSVSRSINYAPQLLDANRLAYTAVKEKNPLNALEKVKFNKDLTWLEKHPRKDWVNMATMSISGKPRYLIKLEASVNPNYPLVQHYIQTHQKEITLEQSNMISLFEGSAFLASGCFFLLLFAGIKQKNINGIVRELENKDSSLAQSA